MDRPETPFTVLHDLQIEHALPSPSARHIEDQQYAAIQRKKSSGKPLSPYEESFSRKYSAAFDVIGTDPIPPTQSLFQYAELKMIKHYLDNAISQTAQFKPASNLVIGTIPLLDINAGVLRVGDAALAILNSGLIAAVDRLAYLITYVSDFPDEGLVLRVNDERLTSAKTYFIETVQECFLYMGGQQDKNLDAELAAGLSPPHPRWQLYLQLLRYAVKRFILAHEYAHVLLGQMGAGRLDSMRTINEDYVMKMGGWRYWRKDIKALSDELDADAIGYFLTVVAGLVDDTTPEPVLLNSIELAWAGAVLTFEIFSMHDSIFDEDVSTLLPRHNYPPRADRENVLAIWTKEQVPDPFLGHLMEVRFGLKNAVGALFATSRADIELILRANSDMLSSIRERLYG